MPSDSLKNSIYKISILPAIAILLFNSCCKSNKCKCKNEWGKSVEDCTPKHYGPYPLSGAYDYLYFEKGSWWVYKNSLSDERDSIYITYCDSGIVEREGRDKRWISIKYTTLAYEMRSDIYDATYKFNRIAIYPDNSNFIYNQNQQKTTINSIKDFGPHLNFTYPFKDVFDLKFIDTLKSMSILGNNYPDIVIYQTTNDPSCQTPHVINYANYPSEKVKYYWSKGYGVIKFETYLLKKENGDTIWNSWELEKCHLIH